MQSEAGHEPRGLADHRPLYLLLGNVKLPEKRRERQRATDREIAERAAESSTVASSDATDRALPVWFDQITRQNRVLGGVRREGR